LVRGEVRGRHGSAPRLPRLLDLLTDDPRHQRRLGTIDETVIEDDAEPQHAARHDLALHDARGSQVTSPTTTVPAFRAYGSSGASPVSSPSIPTEDTITDPNGCASSRAGDSPPHAARPTACGVCVLELAHVPIMPAICR
jgi:hypothetical protein